MDKIKQFKSYIFTGKKETCSGCGACAQICNKQALTMQPDDEGFLFPVLNSEICIKCGLCDSRCPEVADCSNKNTEQHCYIATTNESKYYKESASIGICTMLAEYVINQGGYVYGAYLDESDWSVYHKRVSNIVGVQSIRNSKYVQSNTLNSFGEVKELLNKGKMVLYIGTPCQIAGLKSFLCKDYNTLYTIDLICHGVMSPKLLPFEVSYWEKQFGSRIKNFRFRSKRVYSKVNPGMVNFDIEENGKIKHIERYAASSPSYRCYAYNGDGKMYNGRLSCYNCQFRKRLRYGDITVGDPWCIDFHVIKDCKLETGVVRSLYSTNTAKGSLLAEKIAYLLYQKEYPYENTFKQPATLQSTAETPDIRLQLYKCITKSEYGSEIERILECSLEKEHSLFDRSYKEKEIKEFIKDLMGRQLWNKLLKNIHRYCQFS